jgi:hypothetical protein
MPSRHTRYVFDTVVALLLAGCAMQADSIVLPRTETAYLIGSLEQELTAACRTGTITPTACAKLKDAGEALKAQLFAPPQRRADGHVLLSFIAALMAVRTGQESVRR